MSDTRVPGCLLKGVRDGVGGGEGGFRKCPPQGREGMPRVDGCMALAFLRLGGVFPWKFPSAKPSYGVGGSTPGCYCHCRQCNALLRIYTMESLVLMPEAVNSSTEFGGGFVRRIKSSSHLSQSAYPPSTSLTDIRSSVWAGALTDFMSMYFQAPLKPRSQDGSPAPLCR
jgi:hypothetical protein